MSHVLLLKHAIMKNIGLSDLYFNGMRLPLQFRVTNGTTLVDLKFKLKNLLQCPNHRRVVKIEYHLPFIDNKENMNFGQYELKIDENLRNMLKIFHCYAANGPTKVDATITN